MTKEELRERYLAAMDAYLREVHKTRMLAMQQSPTGFSEQLKREEAAELRYHSAQRAFIEASGERLRNDSSMTGRRWAC